MTSSHRSISRLPLSVFVDLLVTNDDDDDDEVNEAINVHNNIHHAQEDKEAAAVALRGHVSRALERSGATTVGDLLRATPAALLRCLGDGPVLRRGALTHEECGVLVERACRVCAARPRTASGLLDAAAAGRVLSTGLPSLDAALDGGLRAGHVTELVGRAGVGKTQLAAQICATAAARHRVGTVYVDAERRFDVGRLEEMLVARNGVARAKEILRNVTLRSPTSTEATEEVMSNLDEEILCRDDDDDENGDEVWPVGLVVLDSVAAPTRRDFGPGAEPKRAAAVLRIASALKRLADQLGLAVVVTNQVGLSSSSSSHGDQHGYDHDEEGTDRVAVEAALGTSWHHCVTTRLLLEHERDPHRQDSRADAAQREAAHNAEERRRNGRVDDDGAKRRRCPWTAERGRVRTISVVKSNMVGYYQTCFEVNQSGLCELE